MYDDSCLTASDEEYHVIKIFASNAIDRSNY